MNKKILLPILVLAAVVIGIVAVAYQDNLAKSESSEDATNVVQSTEQNVISEPASPSSTSTSYTPIPIDRSRLLSGKFTEDRSPDGEFIAHTFDNEQGDSGVYLTTTSGSEVTATFCGYFREWSPDSKKITVFVPYTCGNDVSENETFELHIDGTISK